MGETVSILIPAYNAEKWIGDTIRSAINQTWPDKEIIVVDDGSRDRTLQVARSFESGGVKVISQENQGACGARNTAYRYAQGDYIQWLDADDLLHPAKISEQLRDGESGRNSLILCTSAFGTFFFRPHRAKFTPNPLWQDLKPVDWIATKFGENVWMNPTAWLVSRKLTDMAGPWDERISRSGDDDGEYICRVVSKSKEVKFFPGSKCYYRIGNLGSLNWKSSKELGPLFLSISLSIGHLISMEDSQRTRKAGISYLTVWYPFFYNVNHELQQKLMSLAMDLQGDLTPPQVSWKYSLIYKMFGWDFTKKVMNEYNKSKLLLVKKWDRLLYNIDV